VINTLSKINKAMTTNGTLFISVPDMSVLAMLLNKDALNIDQRIHIMRMIYGGQISNFDFHYFGYTYEILKSILNEVGFKLIRKVKYFNLHTDTSSFTPYYNLPISLNVICHK
jgi:predicted SAM-dependent methyltransferase